MHLNTFFRARSGVGLDCSMLAGWVGRAAFHLAPVVECLAAHLKCSGKLFMDETRAPVLIPRRGKTKSGFLRAEEVRDVAQCDCLVRKARWARHEP